MGKLVLGRSLVVRVKDVEPFRRAGFMVHPERKLVCLTRDYEYVYDIGERQYVFLNGEDPESVIVAYSLQELANDLLARQGYMNLSELVEKAWLYDNPWAESGWEE